MTTEAANIQIVRDYLAAVESNATGDALARFYTEDAVQVELPNRLNPSGARSDLATLLKRAEQVPAILQSQGYEILSITAQGDRVAVEATWEAVLAIELGTLPPGAVMFAHLAIFFQLQNGRIHRQRNYDCFESF
jgi:ketosteroid isomerase-like protein